MSTITVKDVERVASLGRLKLTDKELKHAAVNLEQILAHFAAIQAIDTGNVPPADDVTGLRNITRDDIAQPDVLTSTDALLAAAPATLQRQVKVRAVF